MNIFCFRFFQYDNVTSHFTATNTEFRPQSALENIQANLKMLTLTKDALTMIREMIEDKGKSFFVGKDLLTKQV